MTSDETYNNFTDFMKTLDKILLSQKYESSSIHRSTSLHEIHPTSIFRAFRHLDEIVEAEFKAKYLDDKLPLIRLFAIRVADKIYTANTTTYRKSSHTVPIMVDYTITALSDNLEEIHAEYIKQEKAIANDPTKVIEIFGLVCGVLIRHFIKKPFK